MAVDILNEQIEKVKAEKAESKKKLEEAIELCKSRYDFSRRRKRKRNP